MSSLYCTKPSTPLILVGPGSPAVPVLNIRGVGDAISIGGAECKRGLLIMSLFSGGVAIAACCSGLGAVDSGACLEALDEAIAFIVRVDGRRVNLASHDSDLSAHLAHGTRLSQLVFALAQLRQAMGVRLATVLIDAGGGGD